MKVSYSTLIGAAFAATIGWMSGAVAQDVAPGTLAAAIRESGNPCQRVIESSSLGASSWLVTCNSGKFKVTRKKDSSFDVVPAQ